MSAYTRLSRMCGPQVPPELLAELAAHRAEHLNEAADVAGDFPGRYADMDAMKAAGVIGPHTMSTVIRDELRAMATASPAAAPVPVKTADDETELERLRARVAELEKDSARLNALYAAGVDSWDGYDIALEGVES